MKNTLNFYANISGICKMHTLREINTHMPSSLVKASRLGHFPTFLKHSQKVPIVFSQHCCSERVLDLPLECPEVPHSLLNTSIRRKSLPNYLPHFPSLRHQITLQPLAPASATKTEAWKKTQQTSSKVLCSGIEWVPCHYMALGSLFMTTY